MDNLYNYLTDPSTIINAVIVIFGLGATRANLNNRIKKTEEDVKELKEDLKKIDITRLETKLAKIEADLERLKDAWQKKHS